MKVRDLLRHLKEADPDAVVLYLAPHADASEADEIVQVTVSNELWTCERHLSADGRVDKNYYPAVGGTSLAWNEATDERWTECVVILSSILGALDG
ncbi:hypothetical protein [Paraburkholderia hospita]|uniref:hypothetical protein n=1 Tax=Paraburkholderia hospita TaxID=169430 RepID=UPI000271BEBB|nr:hypothetical protein [Paraburkholderia hospita]EUC16530.1 hypothetical protein PMI06_004864 [Burkholderia sp. BT03]SKC77751.1 hypothetical protein SAMN06266956_3141 [Paraburkholderia hospita]